MLAGNVTVVMLFMINAIFRGAGDAAIAMRTLWLANWINILLGPCLIFGLGPFPKLGIVGAAIATNIGRGTGALFALSKLFREGGRFNIERRHLRIEPAIIGRLIRLSATGTFQVFIGMASWIGLVRIISSFGSNAVAGYTFGIRVILFRAACRRGEWQTPRRRWLARRSAQAIRNEPNVRCGRPASTT